MKSSNVNGLIIIFLCGCIVAQFGCKKSDETITPVTPVTPEKPDTVFTTRIQHAISWPGLADSPWPMFLHDPQHTGRSAYQGPQLGQMDWMFNAGSNVYSSPAIDVDGTVYFGCENHYFYAVNPNGSLKWKAFGGGSDSSPLISADGTIYCYGLDDTSKALYAYTRNGTLKWKYPIPLFSALSAPTISIDGKTIFLAAKWLYAISKDGSLRWKVDSDSIGEYHYSPAMSPDGSIIYACKSNGIAAIDTSGRVRWQKNFKSSNPCVDNDGNIYAGIEMGAAVVSLAPDGSVRWRREVNYWGTEDAGPVIGSDGTIYITGNGLHAIDYAGKLRWKYLFFDSQCIPAIDKDGTIYTGRNTSRTVTDTINFSAINPDGTLKYHLSLRSPDGTVPDLDSRPAISADGKIYIGSDRPRGFHLYKIK